MRTHLIVLSTLLLALRLMIVNSLDASWIPTDAEGPLPLSSKYRDSLRQLCTLIKSGKTLPADVQAQKKIIKKLCKKLPLADSNSLQSLNILKSLPIKEITISLAFLGGGSIMWANRRSLVKFFRACIYGTTKSLNYKNDIIDINKIREARVKQFEEVKRQQQVGSDSSS